MFVIFWDSRCLLRLISHRINESFTKLIEILIDNNGLVTTLEGLTLTQCRCEACFVIGKAKFDRCDDNRGAHRYMPLPMPMFHPSAARKFRYTVNDAIEFSRKPKGVTVPSLLLHTTKQNIKLRPLKKKQGMSRFAEFLFITAPVL